MRHTLRALVCSSIVLAACGAGANSTLSAAESDSVQLALDGTVPGTAATVGEGGAIPEPPGRHVPAQALAACAGKAAADACTFVHRDRTLAGTCAARPDDATTLVCRPNPPAELVAACSGKAEGDACSFTNPAGEARTGLCHAPRFAGAPILCAPERGGGCHHGGDGGPNGHGDHDGDGPREGGDGGPPPDGDHGGHGGGHR